MKVTANLDDVEQFARSIPFGADGAWYEPHVMAQSMLALVDRVREDDIRIKEQLRAWDGLTLAISVLIEKSSDMSKKEIRAALRDIYANDTNWPEARVPR